VNGEAVALNEIEELEEAAIDDFVWNVLESCLGVALHDVQMPCDATHGKFFRGPWRQWLFHSVKRVKSLKPRQPRELRRAADAELLSETAPRALEPHTAHLCVGGSRSMWRMIHATKAERVGIEITA